MCVELDDDKGKGFDEWMDGKLNRPSIYIIFNFFFFQKIFFLFFKSPRLLS